MTKEKLDEIKRAWGDGNRQSVVCLLLAHIDEQEIQLNSLRETVRFLNDAVRVLEAKL